MARELCRWLDEQGQLWPFYKAWRAAGAARVAAPLGRAVFEQVTGETPEAAETRWEKWVAEGR
jgi:hypothetical protein